MKRQILQLKRHVCSGSAGTETYPDDTFKNRRSKVARARVKKMEHQHARTMLKRATQNELTGED